MKVFTILIFIFLATINHAQMSGVWKGVLIRDGQKIEQSQIIYFDFSAADGIVRSREEVSGKEAFNVRRLKTEEKSGVLIARQGVSEKKKDVYGYKWCTLEFKLVYNDSTGYLSGTYMGIDCKGTSGKIVCFKSKETMPLSSIDPALQSWKPIFIDDLKHNRKSLEVREKERENFAFSPIFFDYDKSEIKSEYYPFLLSIIQVINGHTDLRVKVTGHTDADGSDAYNIALSERRAKAITDYFIANGLSKDKIVIDFRGEKDPMSDNSTEEGKQRNRRVDFSFI